MINEKLTYQLYPRHPAVVINVRQVPYTILDELNNRRHSRIFRGVEPQEMFSSRISRGSEVNTKLCLSTAVYRGYDRQAEFCKLSGTGTPLRTTSGKARELKGPELEEVDACWAGQVCFPHIRLFVGFKREVREVVL